MHWTVLFLVLAIGCGDDGQGYLNACEQPDGSFEAQSSCESGLTCVASVCTKRCRTAEECAHPMREASCSLGRLNPVTGLYEDRYCRPRSVPDWPENAEP